MYELSVLLQRSQIEFARELQDLLLLRFALVFRQPLPTASERTQDRLSDLIR